MTGLQKLYDIRDDSTLTVEEKKKTMREFIRQMNPSQVREFMEESRQKTLIYGPRKEIKRDANKYALIEFFNLNEEFLQKMMMLNSIYYVNSRLAGVEDEAEKEIIGKFLTEIFGTKEDHLGTIEELMLDSTVNIPTLDVPIQTSFEQVENMNNFYIQNYDNLRVATKEMFGLDPTFECTMYVHGLFTESELNRYKETEYQNISDEAVAIKIGEKVLLQPFIENKERVVVYNPYDPSIEKLCKSRTGRMTALQKVLYKRAKTEALEDINPEIMEKIKNYRESLDNLQGSSEETAVEKSRLLEEMIKHIEVVAKDGEKLLPIKTPHGERTIIVTDEEMEQVTAEQ